MRYHELTDHPVQRENPHWIATLSVHQGEWAAMKAVCAKDGSVEIIGGQKVPLIPFFEMEMLCRDAKTARALDPTQWDYSETSPHRPHRKDECLAWGAQFNLFPDLPRDWLF